MKKLFILSALSLVLFSCGPKSAPSGSDKPKIDPKVLVSCDGIGDVKLTDTYESLEKKFGKGALSLHDNTLAGKYLTIWDGKPNQVNVYWEEKALPFKTIKYIETFAPDAPYMTADSITVGMSGKEIEKKNSDMPITMVNPFGTTDPGLIKSFNNGQVATNTPCLGGHIEVSSQRNISKDELMAFQQEQTIDSSHRLMAERMDIVISNFRISKK